jgi:hypothetical protein
MTFYSAPTWYSALPSGARAFKELQVQDQFSIVRGVIEARQTRSSTGAASQATAAGGLLGREFGALAVVAAGVFL